MMSNNIDDQVANDSQADYYGSDDEILVKAFPIEISDDKEPPDYEKAIASVEDYIRFVRYFIYLFIISHEAASLPLVLCSDTDFQLKVPSGTGNFVNNVNQPEVEDSKNYFNSDADKSVARFKKDVQVFYFYE